MQNNAEILDTTFLVLFVQGRFAMNFKNRFSKSFKFEIVCFKKKRWTSQRIYLEINYELNCLLIKYLVLEPTALKIFT
jgi:hypothetical protein